MLEAHNDFVDIKIIELVICLWLEKLGFHHLSPFTFSDPGAARAPDSVLSSHLYNHTLILTPHSKDVKHLCSNSSFDKPVGETPYLA